MRQCTPPLQHIKTREFPSTEREHREQSARDQAVTERATFNAGPREACCPKDLADKLRVGLARAEQYRDAVQ